ncbi:hypothetical protein GCM10010533_46550 [Mycolicibacterium pallens]
MVGLLVHWALLPKPNNDAQLAWAVGAPANPMAPAVTALSAIEKYRFITGEIIAPPYG